MSAPHADPRLIDGRAVADTLLRRVREGANTLYTTTGVMPCLATVLVGDDPTVLLDQTVTAAERAPTTRA